MPLLTTKKLCGKKNKFRHYSLIQIDITVTASDGDCYMSNFRPRQCGLFIVILSSTLSLKTVVFFYPLLFLRLLSPRLKYSRIALCMNALPYAPYFRQRFAPFFRHRRRSQGYLKSRHCLLVQIKRGLILKSTNPLLMVRVTGLEPVRRETHAPQTCLSAYSSTLAFFSHFFREQY